MIAGLRRWAKRHSDRGRYTPVGIAFHWVMALLILFQLGWGWHASNLAPGGDKLAAYEIHSGTGLLILLLACGRLVWRLIIPGPINDADTQGWQTQVAKAIHYAFYVAFFGLPLSGWAMWSSIAEPGPLHVAGIIPWPPLPLEQLPLTLRWQIMDVATTLHLAAVGMLVIIVPLHVLAALKHHFWDRHDVLSGMLPDIPDEEDPHHHRPHSGPARRFPEGSAAG